MNLDARLKALPLSSRVGIAVAQNLKIRSDELCDRSTSARNELVSRVSALLDTGVPAMTVALALGISKSWVVRCRSAPTREVNPPQGQTPVGTVPLPPPSART
jgi:hypothetical protein